MLVAPINSAITNNYNLKICQNAKQRKKKEFKYFNNCESTLKEEVKYINYIKIKKIRIYGKRFIPIASIIDWKPKIIIATPPNISI